MFVPQHDVAALITLVAGDGAAAACAAARLSGAELVMASREELVDCLQLRLGPAIKVSTPRRRGGNTLSHNSDLTDKCDVTG